MEVIVAIYTTLLIVMIVSTMLVAGLSSSMKSLGHIFRSPVLLGLVAIANLVVVPLIGWAMAELFVLDAPSYVALVMIACSPGAPFAAKLIMMQKGDLETGSALQVALAVVGSATFAITANLMFNASGLGDISLPIEDVVKTVVVLQVIPFVVGLAMHEWAPETAAEWRPHVLRASTISFPLVLVLILLGSWSEIVDLIGSNLIVASLLFTVLAAIAGYVLSPGPRMERTTMATVAPMRNGAPVMAAAGIAFDNNPALLAAICGVMVTNLVVMLLANSYVARHRTAEATEVIVVPAPAEAALSLAIPPPRPDMRRAA